MTVSETTGTFTLRANIANPDRLLRPGMFVRATLSQGSSSEALLVPNAGVQRNARGEPTVLVVDGENLVSERIIQVGSSVGNAWLVTGGLAAGERVIVEGLQKARGGITVTPVPAGE